VERVVALLRSVNIGGRRLPMEILREGLAQAGCHDVVTYVQSGNVVLSPPSAKVDGFGRWLEETISSIAGFAVPVVLRTAPDLNRLVAANPYPEAAGKTLHVLFYQEPPTAVLERVDLEGFPPEQATLAGADLYLHLPAGLGRARLAPALERAARRKPPVIGTTRNWNTVLELRRLVGGN
jgi:uncharacterized protein (DUF1697 family)